MASGLPEAAICVQDIDVQCVLQFTLILAAGCALHRHTSRVIHRLELSFRFRVLICRRCASSARATVPVDFAKTRAASTRLVSEIRVGNTPWLGNGRRERGRSLRRFFEPGNYRALLGRRESAEKGTRDEFTTRKQKARSGDRNRFVRPETQGTRTRTPIFGTTVRSVPSTVCGNSSLRQTAG